MDPPLPIDPHVTLPLAVAAVLSTCYLFICFAIFYIIICLIEYEYGLLAIDPKLATSESTKSTYSIISSISSCVFELQISDLDP